jgi:hypothetical protein
MEPIVTTSFIPKRPVSTEAVRPAHPNAAVGFLSLITFVIVIGTGVAFGGVYLYQQSLVSQKAKLQTAITTAQEGLGTSFVTDMKRLSNRITGVRTLIQNHVVVTPIFSALQATTLQSVQYKSFTYEFTADQGTGSKLIQVSITGVAKNYATLALQSDAFAKSTLIRNPIFSNLTVQEKSQQVEFKLVFTVNSADLSYQTFISNLAPQLPDSVTAQ